MQLVDQAGREHRTHRAHEPAAAARVQVAVDLILQPADRVEFFSRDDLPEPMIPRMWHRVHDAFAGKIGVVYVFKSDAE